MRVRCFAVRCSYPVNSSKILAVRNDMENTADTLRNVILSRHSIRDARNLSHVYSNCYYGATGASALTAREATCTQVCHMRVHSKHKVPKAKIIMKDPPNVIGCRHPALQTWREQAAQCFELLCGPAVDLEHPQPRQTPKQ